MIYQRIMPESWHAQAARFVRRFGCLTIANCLWVFVERASLELPLKDRVEEVLGSKCCPVGSCRYRENDASLWIDAKGCFYVVNRNAISFVGRRVREAFEVLLLGIEPARAPIKLREKLARAHDMKPAHFD